MGQRAEELEHTTRACRGKLSEVTQVRDAVAPKCTHKFRKKRLRSGIEEGVKPKKEEPVGLRPSDPRLESPTFSHEKCHTAQNTALHYASRITGFKPEKCEQCSANCPQKTIHIYI